MQTSVRNNVLFFILLASIPVNAQKLFDPDSAKEVLLSQKEDTNKVKLLYNLSFSYCAGSYADTALVYAQQALDLAEKLEYDRGIFWSLITLGESLAVLGNYPLSIEHNFRALALAKEMNRLLEICYGNGGLANCYYYMGEYNTSLTYVRRVMKLGENLFPNEMYWMWINMSKGFHGLNQPDSALWYAKKAYEMIKRKESLYPRSVVSPVLGDAYAANAKYDSALMYYWMGIPIAIERHTETLLVNNYYGIATVYKEKGNLDSALWYSKKILGEKITQAYPAGLLKAANMLADIYQLKNIPDSTLKYLRITIALKDNLFNREKTIAVQNLGYKEQEKQKALEAIQIKFQNRLKTYAIVGFLILSLIAGGIALRNRRQKQLQNMRNSIADDLHDDIGSALSSISIMSELAKKKSPEVSSLLASIGESAISIQENMSDIVWAIKSADNDFENVLQRMNQFASEILDAKSVALDFKADPSLSTSRLTMKQRKNLYLFFKEVINNAAKYSDAEKVSVDIFQKEHHVEMIVKDNGRGFDTSQTFSGNGMTSLRKRVEELRGYFAIRSQFNEGTVVELKFKIT